MVWNTWLVFMTGRQHYKEHSKCVHIDTVLLNEALWLQLYLTTIPHAAVKFINSDIAMNYPFMTSIRTGYTYSFMSHGTYQYTPYEYWYMASLAISGVYTLFGLYRYVFLVLHLPVAVVDVPFHAFFHADIARKAAKNIYAVKFQNRAKTGTKKNTNSMNDTQMTTISSSIAAARNIAISGSVKEEEVSGQKGDEEIGIGITWSVNNEDSPPKPTKWFW